MFDVCAYLVKKGTEHARYYVFFCRYHRTREHVNWQFGWESYMNVWTWQSEERDQISLAKNRHEKVFSREIHVLDTFLYFTSVTESVRGACEHGKQSVTASLFPCVLLGCVSIWYSRRSSMFSVLALELDWLAATSVGCTCGGGSRSCRFSIFFVVTFPLAQDAWARELNSKP